MKRAVFLVVVVALAAGHKISEEDNLPDVDIRKTDVRQEFAQFVRVGEQFFSFTHFLILVKLSVILNPLTGGMKCISRRYLMFHLKSLVQIVIYLKLFESNTWHLKKFRHSRGSLRSNADVKKRYQIFAKNMQTIKSHNKAHSSYRMAVNDFADKVRVKLENILFKSYSALMCDLI